MKKRVSYLLLFVMILQVFIPNMGYSAEALEEDDIEIVSEEIEDADISKEDIVEKVDISLEEEGLDEGSEAVTSTEKLGRKIELSDIITGLSIKESKESKEYGDKASIYTGEYAEVKVEFKEKNNIIFEEGDYFEFHLNRELENTTIEVPNTSNTEIKTDDGKSIGRMNVSNNKVRVVFSGDGLIKENIVGGFILHIRGESRDKTREREIEIGGKKVNLEIRVNTGGSGHNHYKLGKASTEDEFKIDWTLIINPDGSEAGRIGDKDILIKDTLDENQTLDEDSLEVMLIPRIAPENIPTISYKKGQENIGGIKIDFKEDDRSFEILIGNKLKVDGQDLNLQGYNYNILIKYKSNIINKENLYKNNMFLQFSSYTEKYNANIEDKIEGQAEKYWNSAWMNGDMPKAGELKILKLDSRHKDLIKNTESLKDIRGLEGAKLKIDGENVEIPNIETEKNANTINLPIGEYKIEEYKSPEGYLSESAEIAVVDEESISDWENIEDFNLSMEKGKGVYILILNKAETRDIRVDKIWKDSEGNQVEGKDSVEINLLENGSSTGLKLRLDKSTDWKGAFVNLPKYKDGEKVDYTVEEVELEDYISEISGSMEEGFTVTNTKKVPLTPLEPPIPMIRDIKVEKVWKDSEGKQVEGKDSVEINLLENGSSTGLKLGLDESTDWKGVFVNLSKYKDGEEIDYTVEEVELEGYSSEISGSMEEGFTVTNTKKVPLTPLEPSIPMLRDIKVEKVWKDSEGNLVEGKDSVEINLLENGSSTGLKLGLDESTDWKGVFVNLSKYKDGEEIDYTVEEVELEGYISEISGSMEKGFIVTNTKKVPLTPLEPSIPVIEEEEDPGRPIDPWEVEDKEEPKSPDSSEEDDSTLVEGGGLGREDSNSDIEEDLKEEDQDIEDSTEVKGQSIDKNTKGEDESKLASKEINKNDKRNKGENLPRTGNINNYILVLAGIFLAGLGLNFRRRKVQ